MGSLTEVVASTPTDILADVALETANAGNESSFDDDGSEDDGDDGDSNSDDANGDNDNDNGGGFRGFGGFGGGGFKQRKRSHPRRMHF